VSTGNSNQSSIKIKIHKELDNENKRIRKQSMVIRFPQASGGFDNTSNYKQSHNSIDLSMKSNKKNYLTVPKYK